MRFILNMIKMPGWKVSPRYSITIILFLIIIVTTFYPYKDVLIIADGYTKELIQIYQLPNKKFEINYIHSVHKTPVREFYQVENKKIKLYKVEFENYGVGMPADLAEGEKIDLSNGKIIITNMNHNYTKIDLRTGQLIANHQLLINNNIIFFSKIVQPGSWITLTTKKISFLQFIFYKYTS